MKRLLYCVLWSGAVKDLPQNKGVQDQQIKFVEHGKIAAVISDFDPSEISLDIQNLLIYHNVVDLCFRCGPVIPFRFKTILASESEVMRHLDQRGTDYESTLFRLDNKIEMGIRLILDKRQTEQIDLKENENNEVDSDNPGKSYLAKRRTLYTYQNGLDSRCQEIIDASRKAVEGLYIEHKVESSPKAIQNSSGNEILVSIHFLIHKSSVERFREIFDEIRPTLGARVLISGPWAPYNFV